MEEINACSFGDTPPFDGMFATLFLRKNEVNICEDNLDLSKMTIRQEDNFLIISTILDKDYQALRNKFNPADKEAELILRVGLFDYHNNKMSFSYEVQFKCENIKFPNQIEIVLYARSLTSFMVS